jgi:hypothetical protein
MAMVMATMTTTATVTAAMTTITTEMDNFPGRYHLPSPKSQSKKKARYFTLNSPELLSSPDFFFVTLSLLWLL